MSAFEGFATVMDEVQTTVNAMAGQINTIENSVAQLGQMTMQIGAAVSGLHNYMTYQYQAAQQAEQQQPPQRNRWRTTPGTSRAVLGAAAEDYRGPREPRRQRRLRRTARRQLQRLRRRL